MFLRLSDFKSANHSEYYQLKITFTSAAPALLIFANLNLQYTFQTEVVYDVQFVSCLTIYSLIDHREKVEVCFDAQIKTKIKA